MTVKKININLIIGVILSLLFVFLSFSGVSVLEKLELGIYDLGSSHARDKNRDTDKVALIEVDDKSLDALGSWPWPRGVMAEMIDLLKDDGAALIGINIPADERENNEGLEQIKAFRERFDAYPAASENASLKKWVLENLDQIEKKIDNDAKFLESIKDAGNVILPLYSATPADKDNAPDESSLLKNALDASDVSSGVRADLSIERLRSPVAEFLEGSAGTGVVVTAGMNKKGVRSYPVYMDYNGTMLPSFSLRMAASYLGLPAEDMKTADNRIRLKELSIPLSKGEMLIKFRAGDKRYSFADVLNKSIPGSDFRGKVVLIGFNDYETRTLDMPGITTETQLNARLLDNMINSGAISRPAFMPYLEAVFILLTGIAATFILSLKRPVLRPVLPLAAVIVIVSIGLLALISVGLWLKVVCISLCLVSVCLVLLVKDLFLSGVLRRESTEETRQLVADYINRGLLDQAYDRIRKLPHDLETKELVYNLGIEFENCRNTDRAIDVYEYLAGLGGYRDVEDRIERLRFADESAATGSFERKISIGKASDSGERPRTHVGRYEIIDILGKGSMGLVYKAQDPKINRLVAIKTMRFSDEFEEDLIQEIKERFFREAEIAGQLSHPAIVTIHDVGEDDDLTYMAMEFLEGEDLDKYIRRDNLLPFRRVLDIIARTADALDYAHKANVIHRDIKPANIMMLKNGSIKVTDFGIAKAISSSRTKTGVILGTPNYMSPEQIMGQKIDPRSDIFSLGVLFYQLITGELPFHGDNLSGLLYQITQIKHPSPRSHNRRLPVVCDQILDKALAKNPDKRFRSAGELSRVLNALGQRIDQVRVEKFSTK